MATRIFPTVNDVNGGTAGAGRTVTEANLILLAGSPYSGKPYVKSGAALSNGGGLYTTIAAGVYVIGGYVVVKDAAEQVLGAASTTNFMWLQLTVDGSGNVNGSQWVLSAAVPSGQPSVLVGHSVTGTSTVTSVQASGRGIILPGALAFWKDNYAQVGGNADGGSLAIYGDGQTPFRTESDITQYSGDATATYFQTILFDGANQTGTNYGDGVIALPASFAGINLRYATSRKQIPAFVGPKTLYPNTIMGSSTNHAHSIIHLGVRYDYPALTS